MADGVMFSMLMTYDSYSSQWFYLDFYVDVIHFLFNFIFIAVAMFRILHPGVHWYLYIALKSP